jgi:hypothetical protein
MAQIDTLKNILQITDSSQDEVLRALIDQCTAEYKSRTHQTDADENIVVEMAVERYSRLGNEGLESINYSGINEVWYSDYSDRVTALIRSKTRMVTL